jgi:hypothetical protein
MKAYDKALMEPYNYRLGNSSKFMPLLMDALNIWIKAPEKDLKKASDMMTDIQENILL